MNWFFWPFSKARRGPKSHALPLGDIIADFGAYLEKILIAAQVVDRKKLPHDKEVILNALCAALRVSKHNREPLKMAALSLAYFQENVGDQPLHPIGVDITEQQAHELDGQNLARLLVSNPAGKERYSQFQPLVEAETARIKELIAKADCYHAGMMRATSGQI
jgi:hypothetical protein